MTLAITTYTFSVALHVVFVVSFMAPAGAGSVMGPMMRDNPEHALFGLKVTKRIYEVSVFPGIAVVLLTGIYQVIEGNFDGDDLWLSVSVALFAFMLIAIFGFLYPANKTAIAELEAQQAPGPPSERAQQAFKKLGTFGPLMGISMLVITFLMVAQPF